MLDQSRRSEQGFTLIELLVAIMVSGLILSALTTGFITTIRGTRDLHDRFVQTHDAQLLAAYFPSDVQSADPTLGVVNHTDNPNAWAGCTGSPPSDENRLQLQWSETTPAGTTSFTVSYRTRQLPIVPNQTTRYELVRYLCSGATVKSGVVAHNIAIPADPVVSGQNIAMTLTSITPALISTASPYSFTFSGRMRTPVPPPPYPRISSIIRKTATPTSASPVSWKVLFDRPVTGVNGGPVGPGPSGGDFDTVVTGLTSVGAPTVTAVSATEYTVAVTNAGAQGAVALKLVDNDTIKDTTAGAVPLGGTGLGNGDSTGQSYDIDRASPTASSIVLAGLTPTSGPNVSWTVTFSEPVSGVVAANFNPVKTGVTSVSLTVTPVTDTVYNVTAGSVSGSGTIRIDLVDNNLIKDDAANPLGGPTMTDGNFSDPPNATYNITSTAPAAPAITAVQLVDNGTAGKIETGDQVVITFSARLKVSSFCSAWSGDGSNQSVTGGNDVTVSVAEAGSADTLTVSTTNSACPAAFNFGTLELMGDYVSGNVNYAGNGAGNASSLTWDAINHKLTITLGKDTPNGNARTGVASSLPKYSVSTNITDPDPYDQPVTPNSYTATASQRF